MGRVILNLLWQADKLIVRQWVFHLLQQDHNRVDYQLFVVKQLQHICKVEHVEVVEVNQEKLKDWMVNHLFLKELEWHCKIMLLVELGVPEVLGKLKVVKKSNNLQQEIHEQQQHHAGESQKHKE